MNILIVGCGHVGSTLAHDLEKAGHDISIIAKHQDTLRRLHAFTFGGTTTVGDFTDPNILVRAGIKNCDAVAVVSADDAENLMAAQIAKRMFQKENVVCRVSQIDIAEIYEKNYGIKTICPIVLTARAASEGLGALEQL